jgi:hypothetical protein
MAEKKEIHREGYHLSKRAKDSKWVITREGAEKTIKIFDRFDEAYAYAKELADNQDILLVIHRSDGKISRYRRTDK